LAESCQVAWLQGTNDLFALLSNRLLTGYEYTAKYNLGNSVPYDATFQRCNSSIVGGPFAEISNTTRGTFRPIYELAYAHYVSTKGSSMPFTLQIVSRQQDKEIALLTLDRSIRSPRKKGTRAQQMERAGEHLSSDCRLMQSAFSSVLYF
jgi:hypothetical protein